MRCDHASGELIVISPGVYHPHRGHHTICCGLEKTWWSESRKEVPMSVRRRPHWVSWEQYGRAPLKRAKTRTRLDHLSHNHCHSRRACQRSWTRMSPRSVLPHAMSPWTTTTVHTTHPLLTDRQLTSRRPRQQHTKDQQKQQTVLHRHSVT